MSILNKYFWHIIPLYFSQFFHAHFFCFSSNMICLNVQRNNSKYSLILSSADSSVMSGVDIDFFIYNIVIKRFIYKSMFYIYNKSEVTFGCFVPFSLGKYIYPIHIQKNWLFEAYDNLDKIETVLLTAIQIATHLLYVSASLPLFLPALIDCLPYIDLHHCWHFHIPYGFLKNLLFFLLKYPQNNHQYPASINNPPVKTSIRH